MSHRDRHMFYQANSSLTMSGPIQVESEGDDDSSVAGRILRYGILVTARWHLCESGDAGESGRSLSQPFPRGCSTPGDYWEGVVGRGSGLSTPPKEVRWARICRMSLVSL